MHALKILRREEKMRCTREPANQRDAKSVLRNSHSCTICTISARTSVPDSLSASGKILWNFIERSCFESWWKKKKKKKKRQWKIVDDSNRCDFADQEKKDRATIHSVWFSSARSLPWQLRTIGFFCFFFFFFRIWIYNTGSEIIIFFFFLFHSSEFKQSSA